jgi:acetylornithine deacetylase
MRDKIPTLMQNLNTLISTPSISCVNPEFDQSNRAVIDHLATWLHDLGFSVEVMPLTTQPHKANLIATLGTGSGGLVLAGHTDTVPYDQHRWQSDPFQLIERDQRLYGLGSADMKSFFALAMEAAKHFHAKDLKEPLILIATADEESSMDGAIALVEQGRPRARYAIVGEPTQLQPIRAHKGIMMESIRVTGRAGHSSDPSLGNNALEGMHKVMTELLRYRSDIQTRYRDVHFKVPYPTLNLGHIHGGDNPNRICAECELQFDLRPLHGMDPHAIRAELKQRLEHCLLDSGLTVQLQPLIHGTLPMHTDKNAAIVQLAEKLTGHSAQSVAFCTEGPYYNQLGMQTIILGPGHIDQAHQPNEYLALDQITPTIQLLREVIERCCVQADL